ncbi:hypothetical protein MN608_03016 [Microdochium nivale]|nr:hypothetical protein MN608_03016 [Microdochium nivale]
MARFSALSAALVALAFSSQAALVAGQGMDPCVAKSITAAGCSPQDVKCMCKGAAEGNLLTDVLTGMVQYCPKTVDVSGLFATLNSGCKAAGVAIPPQNIQEAQQLAGSVFGPGAGGNGGGGGSSGGSNTSSAQGAVVTKPPTSGETQGLGAPVSQPTAIGQSTVVINTNNVGTASGGNTMLTAPSATPKPNTGSNPGVTQSTSSGGAPAQSGGAGTGTGNNQSAGVRSTASMGAAVIGLAAAVMMW